MDNIREKLVEILVEPCCGLYPASELADYLIEQGVTVQEWIPVSERLPEVGADVLAFGYWNEMWQPLKLHYNIRFKGQWFTSVAGQLVYYVTHWMPLPQPPKGE